MKPMKVTRAIHPQTSEIRASDIIGLILFCCFAFHSTDLSAQQASPFTPGLRSPRHGGVYVVAHRGVHDKIPENTLAAYRAAIDLGCDFVEIDVRTTKDNQLVSIHDATIDKYTVNGQTGKVAEMSLAELKAIDIGSRIDPKWKEERVPTVDEIFQLCQGKIGIYLDVKAANLKELLAKVQAYGLEQDCLWYIPKNKVPELRDLSPRTWPMPDPGPERNLESLLEDCKPQIVASTWKYFSPNFIRRCHESQAIVIVDEGEEASWQPMLDAKVDGIQTDQPEKLIRFLRK